MFLINPLQSSYIQLNLSWPLTSQMLIEMSKWVESPHYSYFLKYVFKPLLLKSLNIEKIFWSAQIWGDEHWLYV